MQKISNNIKIDENGCWNWLKSCSSSGYGQFTFEGTYWNTHRYVWVKLNGDIPKGKVVRHSCHNTKCCNPEHLSLGSDKDNWNDSKEIHLESCRKRRKTWIIDGVKYDTIREATLKTGIHRGSIIKHSFNGIFDVSSYRAACKIANVHPRI